MTDQYPLCDKGEDITQIREDVAFIRGEITSFRATEGRISSLESTARNQNILGSIAALGLACLAWFKDG